MGASIRYLEDTIWLPEYYGVHDVRKKSGGGADNRNGLVHMRDSGRHCFDECDS